MTKLVISEMSLTIDNNQILKNINLTVSSGEIVAVLGSNGAGKSTLVRCALDLVRKTSGLVEINGTEMLVLTHLQRARKVSYLPQTRPVAWPLLVRHVVALGRFAYGASIEKLSTADAAAVDNALQKCDLVYLAERRIDSLSGGELARVHCARAFAAESSILLADEPITALDPKHQLQTMHLLRNYVDHSHGVLVILHDPELAARYADRIVWMKAGQIIADGSPKETVTPSMLEKVYSVEADVLLNKGSYRIDCKRPI